MTHTLAHLFLASALVLGASVQAHPTADEAYPPSTALAENVSPKALAELSHLVQSFVDDDHIVGAELLVIKNGRSILHQAYGWRDREAELPMETDSVFCVRSMTKPLIATAILMLIEDGLLDIDDHISEFLPSFDHGDSQNITIEHLLQHTSGLPMSQILNADLTTLDGIQAVAELGATAELSFEPGDAFSYSDQGTDTLTALIEVVSGMSAADFVSTRVLAPLGMNDSTCVMTDGHPLRERACCKYYGASGSWTRFWGPDAPPLFPFFLGSQGLYSTLTDYARFMDFWRRGGLASEPRSLGTRLSDLWNRTGSKSAERLLGPEAIERALTPGPYPIGAPTGFPGLTTAYGSLMQLWTGPGAENTTGETSGRKLAAFGHTGSDGTHAWVFPEQKAMVLYFTQSRGNTTTIEFEEALAGLLLGAPYDPEQDIPPLEPYTGYYFEGEGDKYRAIIRHGDGLALEIMGRGVVPLKYVGDDQWKLRPDPSKVLKFQLSETGDVTGYSIGDHHEYRFEPAASLPSVEAIAARATEVHQMELAQSLGPLRMTGEVFIKAFNITAQMTTLLEWPDRFRVDNLSPGQFERIAYDGEHVWSESSMKPLGMVGEQPAELLRFDNPLARFGDLLAWHPELQVIQRLERDNKALYLLRTGGTSGPARSLYVDADTGRVIGEDSLTFIDGMGTVGQSLRFGDFRDISGMLLPYRTEISLANKAIGTIVSTVDEIELGVELPRGTFELQD